MVNSVHVLARTRKEQRWWREQLWQWLRLWHWLALSAEAACRWFIKERSTWRQIVSTCSLAAIRIMTNVNCCWISAVICGQMSFSWMAATPNFAFIILSQFTTNFHAKDCFKTPPLTNRWPRLGQYQGLKGLMDFRSAELQSSSAKLRTY